MCTGTRLVAGGGDRLAPGHWLPQSTVGRSLRVSLQGPHTTPPSFASESWKPGPWGAADFLKGKKKREGGRERHREGEGERGVREKGE